MSAKVVITILGFLAFTSCGASEVVNRGEERSIRADSAVVTFSEVAASFVVPGTIRAKTATVLSSKIVGQIVRLDVREGDRVRAGQLVVELEDRQAVAGLRRAEAGVVEAQRGREEAEAGIRASKASVRTAEANRDLALSTQKRYEVLRDRRSVSPQEYDEAETRHLAAAAEVERATEGLSAAEARQSQALARIEQAEAEVESATSAHGYARILSPIDGVVTLRTAEPGMLAAPGVPLLTIEDPRTYELEVAVEESRIGAIRLGQTVPIEIDALGGAPMEGRVREIASSSGPAARTYAVKLQLMRAPVDPILKTGFFGRASFPAVPRQALVVPASALVRRGQLEGVYVVEGDVAIFRLVKTGHQHDQGIEILSGIASGTRILTAPPPEVVDGIRITP